MSDSPDTGLQADLPAPSLLRRLVAMVYDTFLVVPLIMVCDFIALWLWKSSGNSVEDGLPQWIVQLIIMFCCIGFFGVFWSKSGQTLGMQAWRIRLVPSPGRELTFQRIVVRCLAALLSAACFGLGYLWCLFDRRRRTWQDHLSGTELVLLPRRSRNG